MTSFVRAMRRFWEEGGDSCLLEETRRSLEPLCIQEPAAATHFCSMTDGEGLLVNLVCQGWSLLLSYACLSPIPRGGVPWEMSCSTQS